MCPNNDCGGLDLLSTSCSIEVSAIVQAGQAGAAIGFNSHDRATIQSVHLVQSQAGFVPSSVERKIAKHVLGNRYKRSQTQGWQQSQLTTSSSHSTSCTSVESGKSTLEKPKQLQRSMSKTVPRGGEKETVEQSEEVMLTYNAK